MKSSIKRTAAILAAIMAVSALPAYAETKTYSSAATIKFEEFKDAGLETGSKVTCTIVEYGTPFSAQVADKTKFYGVSEVQSNKDIVFDAYIEENGVYDMYIGNKAFSEPKKYTIRIEDEAKSDTAATAVVSALGDSTALETAISSNLSNLGVFDENGTVTADVAEVATLVQAANPTADNVAGVVKKAVVATLLNDDSITDIDDYYDLLGIENTTIGKYYKSKRSSAITSKLDGTYTTVEQFETALRDAIILSVVNNNDGTGEVQNMLSDFKTEIGLTKDVTSGLASHAIANAPYNAISGDGELTSTLNSYTPPAGGGPQGSSGPSGVSGSTGNFTTPNTGTSMPVFPESNVGKVSAFDDLDSVPWAVEAIEALYNKGIISGKAFGVFAPLDNVKREEFAKMLSGTFDLKLVGEDEPFEDVSETDWFYDSVRTAYIAGITTGISDTMFGTGLNITRQDLCTMVYKALTVCQIEIPVNSEGVAFADADQIADYAKEAVTALNKAGIVNGKGNDMFDPRGNATRAEAAQILYKMSKLLEV